MKPYTGAFVLSLFGFILFACMDVLAADMMQFLIDSIGGHIGPEKKVGIISTLLKKMALFDAGNVENARVVAPLIIVVLAIVRSSGFFIGNYNIRRVGNMVVFDLRQKLFEQMVRLPISYITSKNSGSLISRIIYNVSQVSGSVTTALTTYFREGLTVIFLFGYLIYINWKLTITFIVIAPFVALLVNVVSKRFRRLSHKMQSSMGDITHVISETVNGNREVRVYGAQQSEINRFFGVSKANLKQQLKMAATSSAFPPLIQIMLTFALAVLVWLGLDPAIVGSMSSGLFVSYLIAAGAIGKPIRQLTSIMNTIQQGLAAAEDIFTQFDEPLEQETGSKTLSDVKVK